MNLKIISYRCSATIIDRDIKYGYAKLKLENGQTLHTGRLQPLTLHTLNTALKSSYCVVEVMNSKSYKIHFSDPTSNFHRDDDLQFSETQILP